tara:strand:- start:705 stop:2279 length:1575 start_codon:yes stop_codon:yes gene_type:complete
MDSVFLASSWKPSKNIRFFRGWAFSEEALIVGQKGFDKYIEGNTYSKLRMLEGRYLLCFENDCKLSVNTDFFGSEPIFWFSDGLNWAVSNSFYKLQKLLEEKSVPLTIDDDVLSNFEIPHSSCQQLIGTRTLFKEIKLCPQGYNIEVLIEEGWVSLVSKENSLSTLDGSYEELLLQGLEQAVLVTKEILKNYEENISADITGGIDSRLVLAILLNATNGNLKFINFNSNVNEKRDYYIASKLAEKYNFKITNEKSDVIKVSSHQRYEVWRNHNLGVYLPIYEPEFGKDIWFHFHGGGGELFRQFYSNSPLVTAKVLSRKHGNGKAKSLVSVLQDFCNDNNLDPSSVDSMYDFYLKNRSRLHFGRGIFTSFRMNVVQPLLNKYLIAAASKLTNYEVESNKMIFDMFKILEPTLLDVEFDSEDKFSKIYERQKEYKPLEENKVFQKSLEFYAPAVNLIQYPVEQPLDEHMSSSFDDCLIRDLVSNLGDRRSTAPNHEAIEELLRNKNKIEKGYLVTKIFYNKDGSS